MSYTRTQKLRFLQFLARKREEGHSYDNLVTPKQGEELPELVNVTERYVLSFRVLNNPLNSIPALQFHTEKQEVKDDAKAIHRGRQVNTAGNSSLD